MIRSATAYRVHGACLLHKSEHRKLRSASKAFSTNPLLCENLTFWLPHSGQDFALVMNKPRRFGGLILTNQTGLSRISRFVHVGNGRCQGGVASSRATASVVSFPRAVTRCHFQTSSVPALAVCDREGHKSGHAAVRNEASCPACRRFVDALA